MSIEYTIDIQLTELGFLSDAPHPRATSIREAPCCSTSPDDSSSPSHPPTTGSATLKQRLQVTGDQSDAAVKQAKSSEQSAVDLTSPLVEAAPSSLQAEEDGELHDLPAPTLNDPSPGPEQLEQDKNDEQIVLNEKAAQEGSAEVRQDEEEDSGDSDVSGVYEDDEVYEEDEEEEDPNTESSQTGDYSCSVCGLQLSSKFKLQDHMNLHTGARPYCCAECGKRFCQTSSYRAHLRTHAQSEVERFQCRVCRKDFPYQEDLKYHLAISHWEDKYYECDQCKRVFTSLEACEYHVSKRECLQKAICEKCGRTFSSSKHLARHKKKICHCSFRCTDCKKTFTKKNALLKHSFSHLGLLPYTCVRCRCHFRLAKLYLQHKCEPERIHCVACLREFLSQKDFKQHKKDTGCWGNQEPKGDEIRCLECGQRFDTSDELKKHAGAHQRVLKCAECNKGFRSALLLMSHMGGHAGNSPCLCQSCGLGFPHQQNYDSHLKTCGRTPQSKNSAKKRHISTRLPSRASLNTKAESQSLQSSNAKPESLRLRQIQAKPAPSNQTDTKTSAIPDVIYKTVSAQASHNLGPVSNDLSAAANPSSGLWKLTLDRPFPPAAELVLFLPVCATQSDGLALPSMVHQTPAAPAMLVQPQVAFPHVSQKHLGADSALKALLNAPLDLATGIKQDPDCELPFDLSMKSSKCAASAPAHLPVKSEPEDFRISPEAIDFKRHALGYSNTEPHTEVKPFKNDPLDLSASSGLVKDIKKEAS
ncbi:zinc finger protein 623 [Xyrichtys novacula]|uniref:Zinc finger protein 623 n=1 Tax=Xyrichtys novacula TaxID=13765 RepID=A0AAV1FMQ6_XYRNO|nr:zinc finger protein 623 [Xyrichtys novacula]